MSKTVVGDLQYFWFECPCGHRSQQPTQRAKTLAFRLHQKKCESASGLKLGHAEFQPVMVVCEQRNKVAEEVTRKGKNANIA